MTTVYSDQVKAEALARVLAGESVSEIARDMQINRVTLQTWLRRESNSVAMVATGANRPTLVGRIGDYLDANLLAMANQASRMGERSWIDAQTTSDLIAAHNELGKRAVSILDRLHPAIPTSEPRGSDS